jgi:hypothetical protein
MVKHVKVKTIHGEIIHDAPISPPVKARQIRRALEQQYTLDSLLVDLYGNALAIVTRCGPVAVGA